MLKGKVIGVTGGQGFIGSHLMEKLYTYKPKKVYNLDLSCNIDLTDYDEMENFLKFNKIDVIFHLATLPLPLSLQNPHKVVNDIITMTNNLCKLLKNKLYKTLIQISSSEAYGSALTTPMTETHPLNPTTPYAAAKASADLILLSYHKTFGINAAIARCFNTYGERQPITLGAVIPKTVYNILKGKSPEIYGSGNQTRDFTYVADTIKGIIGVYTHPKTRGKVINIGSGKETQIKEVVIQIYQIMRNDYDIWTKKSVKYIKERVADVSRHYADISLARLLTSYSPSTSLVEGLKRTIKYYVDNISNLEGVYTK